MIKAKLLKQGLIKDLKNIFKQGYIPSRERQSYRYLTKSNDYAYSLINCFAHSFFNLTNEQIDQIKLSSAKAFNFGDWNVLKSLSDQEKEKVLKKKLKFINDIGLNVEKGGEYDEIKSNQWKIAYYFDMNLGDLHFMLQERDGSWSSKKGKENIIERSSDLPYVYDNRYILKGVLIVTNPNAKTQESEEENS